MKLIKQILVFTWLKLFEMFKYILVGCWYVSFWGGVVFLISLIVYWSGFSIIKMFGITFFEGDELGYIIAGLFFLMLIFILYQIHDSRWFKKWIKKNWKEAGRIVGGKK